MSKSPELIFKGIPASTGVVSGSAFVLRHEEVAVPSYQVAEDQLEGEVDRFEQALLDTRYQLLDLRHQLAQRVGETEATIFDVHLLVLEDKALIEETIRSVYEDAINIEKAFYDVAKKYIEAFSQVEDPFIQERVADIKDVSRRLVHNLLGKNLPLTYRMSEPSILIANDLTPSEAAILEPGKVLAVVTELGGRTGHAAIIARALGVPAVMGVRGILNVVQTGDSVLVDGSTGEAVYKPSADTLKSHGKGMGFWEEKREQWMQKTQGRVTTIDSQPVKFWANIESVQEGLTALEHGAEGVGLFRTEFLFLRQQRFPGEDEQFEAYKELLQSFGDKPVVIRTLDLGGDKRMGRYFSQNEKEPFMGYRAIRFCLENRDIFRVQLRALLRASVYGRLKIMFPMISGAGELEEALGVLMEARRELDARKIDYNKSVGVGSMIEVPSAALTLDQISEHCQFVSIGTNDLIQYLLACDRVNDRIAYLYEPTHLAVVRTLRSIVHMARSSGVELSICGEMAGDGIYLPMLLGLGIRRFSLNARAVPELKHLARNLSTDQCQRLMEDFLAAPGEIDLLGNLRRLYGQLVAL